MPNYTTNLRLEKPLQSEQYNIDVFNANADKIDQFAGQIPPYALTADKLTTGAKINGVNFKGDSDITLPTVNTSGNQTVGGVKTFNEVIQGTIVNAQNATNDGNGDKIDETYIKTADLAEKWHALKGYEDAGELLTDAEGLSDVIKYAHSSFDLSKFTVVGSPVITDDGIASGFSSSNYIRVPYLLLGQNFKIFTPKFNSSDVSQIQTIVRYSDGNIRIEIYQNKIRLYRYSERNAYNLPVGQTTLQNNTDYYYYVEQTTNGADYYLKGYISTDNKNWVLDIDRTYTSAMYDYQNNAPIQISGTDALIPFIGTLDLKQFSITVDGKEVFSGNKTGLDVIKPDNYTVMGSPVISEDGIASGFSLNDYITVPDTFQFSSANNWAIYVKFRITDLTVSPQIIFDLHQSSSLTPIRLMYNNYSNHHDMRIGLQNQNGNIIDLGATTLVNNISENEWYTYRIKFTGTEYIISSFVNGNWEVLLSKASTEKIADGQYFKFGLRGAAAQPLSKDSIDLNAFKIYVDNNLVYQPCLKIPYTKGSEQYGGKYVNAQYLDRVKDAYEQGLANDYFTLDEVNGTYTLPMGNLYGMIEKLNQLEKDEIGLPKATLSNTLNDNEIWLEGAEVSKLTYSKLYAIYGDDYGTPADSANFVLPDFRNRVMQGIGSGGSFGYISAGLPNITGSFGRVDTGSVNAGGAFRTGGSDTGHNRGTENSLRVDYNFDASRSSSIYGNSTTVQPPAIKVRVKTRFQ